MRAARRASRPPPAPIAMTGPLIAATRHDEGGLGVPQNPLVDETLDASRLSEEIRRGFRSSRTRQAEAPRLAPGGMSCSNCHMNAGQREKSLPLVDVAGMFPEYNSPLGQAVQPRRSHHRLLSSQRERDRRRSCASDELPTPTSPEVLPISAYLTWLAARRGDVGRIHRGAARTPSRPPALIPVEKLDPRERRSDLQRSLRDAAMALTDRACRLATRSPVRSGAAVVERRRRRRAGLYAGRHDPLFDALPRSGQHHRRGRAARRCVHRLEAASRVSVQGARLPRREAARRRCYYTRELKSTRLGD